MYVWPTGAAVSTYTVCLYGMQVLLLAHTGPYTADCVSTHGGRTLALGLGPTLGLLSGSPTHPPTTFAAQPAATARGTKRVCFRLLVILLLLVILNFWAAKIIMW